jgi:dTDP-4-amino-4,6-dideoxygalactose transaminase
VSYLPHAKAQSTLRIKRQELTIGEQSEFALDYIVSEYRGTLFQSPHVMTKRLTSAADTGNEPMHGAVDGFSGVGSLYPWPLADDAVREALARAFADGSWGRYHGPHCARLRAALAAMHGSEHVTLCSSGTVAVELALRGVKVGPRDEVILAGYDFPGNFRAIEAIGARPVLVDIDPATWCLNPASIAGAVGPQTRAIIVSHLHGGMADMPRIIDLSREHGVAVVEDACQAPGATIDDRLAGTWGDVGVLSFGGSKVLTAGRGGALLTKHAEIHQRVKVHCERGNDAFPLSELQAAVLLPQLERLTERNRKRRESAAQILAAMKRFGLLQPIANRAGVEPGFYKLAWLWCGKPGSVDSREDFLEAAQSERIPLDAGFRGFALRSSRRCRVAGDLRHSQAASARTIVLHHPVLLAGDAEVVQMIGRLVEVLERSNPATTTRADCD